MAVIGVQVLKQDGTRGPGVIRTTVFDATDPRRYEQELLAARQRAEQAEARPVGRGDEVGGDFYDVFETARGDWAVILGDGCGKGAEAAGITALARSTARAAAMRTRRPRLVLATLNEALIRQNAGRFCTVVYARLRISRGDAPVRLTIASGGHQLPVRLGAAAPPATVGTSGPLLGVFDEVTVPETVVELAPGDVVAFHTDGVTEGRRGREFFGDARLHRVLSACRDQDGTPSPPGSSRRSLRSSRASPETTSPSSWSRCPTGTRREIRRTSRIILVTDFRQSRNYSSPVLRHISRFRS